MAKKIIKTEKGYQIKEYDTKGNSKGVISGTFSTEEEAQASIKPVKRSKKK